MPRLPPRPHDSRPVSDAQNRQGWGAIEQAWRRLVSSLTASQLTVASKVSEDAACCSATSAPTTRRHFSSAMRTARRPAGWALRHVSAFASTHPWVDSSGTWSQDLHMTDALAAALSVGLDGSRAELLADPITPAAQHAPGGVGASTAGANLWLIN